MELREGAVIEMDRKSHEAAVMGTEGDTKIIWDPDNEDEVDNARRSFDELIEKGYAAFNVGRSGRKSDRISKFDSEAEKMILVPPIQGG